VFLGQCHEPGIESLRRRVVLPEELNDLCLGLDLVVGFLEGIQRILVFLGQVLQLLGRLLFGRLLRTRRGRYEDQKPKQT
jgi:hypothetical protein